MADTQNKDTKAENRIKSCDYGQWDKYDAEAECVKLDVEEEKRKEEKEKEKREEMRRKAKELAMQEEERITEELKETVKTLTEGEKKVLALKEKDLGNEFYKVNDLEKALIHYTRSINIQPTAVAHNNRAATYLKQCKYSKALEDTNIVLQMDPNNVKAYYRRALSLQHKNEFHKALDDIREVLKREPNHVIARHVADQLRDHCRDLPRKCKLLMKDDQPNNNPNNMKVVEVTEAEMLRDYKDKNFVEVNDFGLPKIMCNCNGKYTNDPGIRHDHRIRFQHLNKKNQKSDVSTNKSKVKDNVSITKIEDITDKKIEKRPLQFSVGDKHVGQSKRLEILEMEKIAENKTETEPNGSDEKAVCDEKEECNNVRMKSDPKEIKKNCEVDDVEMKEEEDNINNKISKDIHENEKGLEELEKENLIVNFEASSADLETKGTTNVASDSNGIVEKIDVKEEEREEKKNVPNENNKSSTSRIEEEVGCKKFIIEKKDKAKGNNNNIKAPRNGIEGEGSGSSHERDQPCFRNNVEQFADDAVARDVIRELVRETYQCEQRLNSFETGLDDATPQAPIEVAKKYREKVSQPKKTKQLSPTTVTFFPEPQKHVEEDPKSENDGAHQLRFFSPHEFAQKWSILERSDGAFEEKARLLRSVRPHLLQAVIGSKLDDVMLSNFLNCLQKHFNMHSEPELITEYLTAIMQLERFSIIYSFLTKKEKMIAQNLLEMLGPHANEQLQKAYY